MKLDISEVTMEVPYPVFLAVGLPQGLRMDPKGTVIGGVVTCGGQRVALDPYAYSLWLIMQAGLSEKQVQERFKTQLGADGFNAALKILLEKKLISRITSSKDLDVFETLRAIPKATGVGSLDKEHPLRYIVKPNFGDKEVVMNPLDYAIWTMWDGKTTVMGSWKQAAKTFQLRPSEVVPRQVGILILLIGQGLTNVDYT